MLQNLDPVDLKLTKLVFFVANLLIECQVCPISIFKSYVLLYFGALGIEQERSKIPSKR